MLSNPSLSALLIVYYAVNIMFLYLTSLCLPGEEYSLNDRGFGIRQFHLPFDSFQFLRPVSYLLFLWFLSWYLFLNFFRRSFIIYFYYMMYPLHEFMT